MEGLKKVGVVKGIKLFGRFSNYFYFYLLGISLVVKSLVVDGRMMDKNNRGKSVRDGIGMLNVGNEKE